MTLAGLVLCAPLLTVLGAPPPAGAAVASWTAFVANGGDGTVTPIDTATGAAGPAITVGSDPQAIAITPDGTTAYVANAGSNTVTPIDTGTGTPGTPVEVGNDPFAIAITPDGTTAYVANAGSNTVTPIDTATGTPGTPVAVGAAPEAIAITPDGTEAYVVDAGANEVTPIDLGTDTAGPPIAVGRNPLAIAITPDGTTAYVTDYGSGTVTPIDLADATAGPALEVGNDPDAIAITPDGSTAYVTNETDPGTVTPLTLGGGPGTPVAVGVYPQGVAVAPDGATAYVVGSAGTVTPVTTATGVAGPAIAVGTGPDALAVTPDQSPVAQLRVTAAPLGSPTLLDASASSVAVGTIASYAWNFGDGQTATTASPTTTHVYTQTGTFTASVTETSSGGTSTTLRFTGQTASNNGGPSATASEQFTVDEAPAITSADSATFVTGTPDTFDVTASGVPAPTFSESGPLPSGVTLDPGSGVLSGTAAPGTGGTYPITVIADNGVSPAATQEFTLSVISAPEFTSPDQLLVAAGRWLSLRVAASGTPTPTLHAVGPLPGWLTFRSRPGGSAILSGISPATPGELTVAVAADSGSAKVTQDIAIDLLGFTSASAVTFYGDQPNSLTVTTAGAPGPVALRVYPFGLPAGVTFVDHGNGTGTLSGTPTNRRRTTYVVTLLATCDHVTAFQQVQLTVAPDLLSGLARRPSPSSVRTGSGRRATA